MNFYNEDGTAMSLKEIEAEEKRFKKEEHEKNFPTAARGAELLKQVDKENKEKAKTWKENYKSD
jgi:hypothetical protein